MRGRLGADKSEFGAQARQAAQVLLAAAPWIAMALMAVAVWRRRGKASTPPKPLASLDPQAFEVAEPGRGRLAVSPRNIPPAGWKDVLWRTYREVLADRLPSVAGGVTFYALLAIFPAIGAFVALYGIFADVGQVQGQLAQFRHVIPREVLDIVSDQMVRLAARKQTSGAAFVISLLFSVWSANAGMKALFDGLNAAYGEIEKRNIFARSALTYGFTFAALLFLTLVTGVLVAVPIVLKSWGWAGLSAVWIPLRWIALLAVAGVSFAAVYRYGPSRAHPRWRWVRPGGVLAAFFWLAGSLVFSLYLNSFAHFDVAYGSLGAVIGFMMWIWFSVLVVLVGAEFSAQLEHQTALDTTTGAPQPMGRRGAVMADTVGPAFRLKFSDSLTQVSERLDAGFDRAVTAIRRG